MPNLYVDLATLKGTAALNLGSAGTAYDNRLLTLLEDVSRAVDDHCHRRFSAVIETRYYDGPGSLVLHVGDFISVTAIGEDARAAGTWDTAWASSDWLSWPYNAAPTARHGGPHLQLHVNRASNGTQDEFIAGQRAYEVTGTWGFWKVQATSGLNGTLTDGTGTSLVLSGTVGTALAAGMTLLVEDEYLYVATVPSTTATSMSVQRALNGSTGTAHTNKAVQVVQYPGPVVEAVFIQAARLWKRKDSAFANQIGFPDSGVIQTFTGTLDPDVKQLLRRYRRMPV